MQLSVLFYYLVCFRCLYDEVKVYILNPPNRNYDIEYDIEICPEDEVSTCAETLFPTFNILTH